MNKKLIIIMIAGAMFLSASATAQVIYGAPAMGGLQFTYTDWKIKGELGETSLSQTSIPLSGFVPLQENLDAAFYIASAFNNLDQGDNSYSLSGLGDIRVMLNRSFSEDRFLASVGLNLPIGKKNLNLSEELIVVEYLSENYLSFPVRRLGEGLGISLMLGTVGMVGELKCGAGIMYQVNGSYEPYIGFLNYNPGDMLSANGGVEYNRDKLTISANLIYSTFGSDEVIGIKAFEQGDQVDISLRSMLDNKSYDATGMVRYVWRGRNTTYTLDGSVIERLKYYGNEFSIGGIVSFYPIEDWSLSPALEYRSISANENEFGGSSIFGFGGSIGRQLNEQIDLGFGFKYYTGKANDSAFDLTGMQITAGLSAKL